MAARLIPLPTQRDISVSLRRVLLAKALQRFDVPSINRALWTADVGTLQADPGRWRCDARSHARSLTILLGLADSRPWWQTARPSREAR